MIICLILPDDISHVWIFKMTLTMVGGTYYSYIIESSACKVMWSQIQMVVSIVTSSENTTLS